MRLSHPLRAPLNLLSIYPNPIPIHLRIRIRIRIRSLHTTQRKGPSPPNLD